MKTDVEIRANIMGRVRRVHFLRTFANPALKVGAFVAALFLIFQSVSVGNVVSNALNISSISGFFNFTLHAITNTEPTVQALLVISLVLGVWMVFEELEKRRLLKEMGI